jgi:signal transduction histidine kinase
VVRLQNVAELMDNILTRSRLTDQAALQARMEHLAMMSRGLAHDLKNLVTPVSSFLVYTEGRHPADSAEAEVHTAAQRSMRIITDYLREALFFAERREPKLEPVDLAQVFARVRDVTAERAARRRITVALAQDFADPLTADGVLLQRMLVNLVANAIDASSPGQTVQLAARPARAGWLRLEVSDQGCGIPPDLIDRIFDPYFTTKQFGDEVRGFGLGLTVSQKIVHLHRGTIGARSQPGRGTVITVEIPAAPETPPAN